MVPTPSDYSLSEFSEGEAFIIPLLCRTLEALGSTNERLDLLTATVENLELTASPQTARLFFHVSLPVAPPILPHACCFVLPQFVVATEDRRHRSTSCLSTAAR